MARAVCEVEPRPPSLAVASQPRLARRLRGDLDTIVLKALSKEPSRRYASAEALAEDVRRHLAGHPVQARRDTMAYVVAKFVRRHKVGVAAAAVATLSLLLGLVGTTWQAAVAARERDRARLEAERAEKVKEFLVGLFKASDPVESKGEAITARELLDRGTERIEKDLAGHAALQAELFETVAAHLAVPRPLRPGADARRAFGRTHAAGVRARTTLRSPRPWTRSAGSCTALGRLRRPPRTSLARRSRRGGGCCRPTAPSWRRASSCSASC